MGVLLQEEDPSNAPDARKCFEGCFVGGGVPYWGYLVKAMRPAGEAVLVAQVTAGLPSL